MKTDSLMHSSEYTDMFAAEDTLWWYRATRDILRYCVKDLPEKSAILDAGCGTGMNVAYLRSLGYSVRGIDLSSLAIDYAKKRNKTGVRVASITEIPFPQATFDAVICLDVIGTLRDNRDILNALKEIRRVLKPDGILILQCAAFERLRSPHDTVTNIRIRFSKQLLVSFFSKQHWLIKKCSYRVFFLLPLIFIVRFLKNMRRSAPTTDITLPHPTLNSMLYGIQRVENTLFHSLNFPLGSSVLVVARKIS